MDYNVCLMLIFLLGELHGSYAVYCSYKTSTGAYQFTFCMEKCCPGNNLTYQDVCCRYSSSSEVYIGAGLAAIILIGLFLLCATYVCCKKRMLRQAAASNRLHANPRTRPRSRHSLRHNDVIPSISLQVEPPLPPSYDELPPPPYSLINKTQEDTKLHQVYPDDPPPEYTQTAVKHTG